MIARRRIPPPLAIILCLLFAALWTGAFGLRHWHAERSPLDGIEDALASLRLLIAGSRAAPAGIAIIAIDDATVAGEGGYPLDRARLAALIGALRFAGARTVALDLLLADRSRPDADAALVDALAAGPSVIATAARFAAAASSTDVVTAEGELAPLPAFAAVAGTGFVNVAADAGGVPRHVPLLLLSSTAVPKPSFALAAAALHRQVEPTVGSETITLGADTVPLDAGWHLPLRFYGPHGTILTIAAQDFLAPRHPPPRLDGALAVVGVTATAVGDVFATPFDPVLPGVEVQATAIAHLLKGDGLRRDGVVRALDAAAAVSLALAGTLGLLLLPPAFGASLAGMLLLFALGASCVLFALGVWASAALPLASVVPFAAAGWVRVGHDRRLARQAEDGEAALRRLQPELLADRLARDPDFLAQPLSLDASVLFIDLAGFTTRSERLGPERTRAFLKAFHTLAVEGIAAHRGVVLNLMGDGALAVFGLDERQVDPAGDAFAATFALVEASPRRLAAYDPDGGPPSLRAGLHHGPLVLSRLGHEAQQQITVAGDTVNLASRLMEVAKAHQAVVAATAETLRAAKDVERRRPPDETILTDIRGRAERKEVCLWRGSQDRP